MKPSLDVQGSQNAKKMTTLSLIIHMHLVETFLIRKKLPRQKRLVFCKSAGITFLYFEALHMRIHLCFFRECRGLIFDEKGKVLSRRFHKFFNVNELAETNESCIDISRPHILTEKVDGYFILQPILILTSDRHKKQRWFF